MKMIIRVVEFPTIPQRVYPLDADEAFNLPSGVIKKGGEEAWRQALEKLRACPSLAVGGTGFTVKGEAKECLDEGTFVTYPDGYEESICSLKELICSPKFKGKKFFIYEVDVYD